MLLVISSSYGKNTFFEVKSLKLHFLQENWEFIFRGNFVEVEAVGFSAKNFMANVLLLDLSNPRSVALNHIDLSVSQYVLLKLFHNI